MHKSVWTQRNAFRKALFEPGNELLPLTRLVLAALLNYANEQMTCWPSEKTLAANCGLSERSVRTHLKLAVKAGWIERKKLNNPGKTTHFWHYTVRLPSQRPEPRSARTPRQPANDVVTTGNSRSNDRNAVPPILSRELFNELRIAIRREPKTVQLEDAAKTARFFADQLGDQAIECAYLDCATRVGAAAARKAVSGLISSNGGVPSPEVVKDLLLHLAPSGAVS